MKIQTDKSEEVDVQIFLQTTVRKILRENCRIRGIIAEDTKLCQSEKERYHFDFVPSLGYSI